MSPIFALLALLSTLLLISSTFAVQYDLSRGAESIAESVKKAMNTSVSPCDDFYTYACGGWIANATIPDDETRYTRSFSEIEKRNAAILLKILRENQDPMIRGFFDSCMDEATIEAKGIEAGVAFLNSIEQLVVDAEETLPATIAVVGYLHKMRISTFFELFSEQDAKEPQTTIAQFLQGGTKIPTSAYKNDTEGAQKLLSAYQDHMEKMFDLIHFDKVLARRALDVEMKLASFFQSDEELDDPFATYNKFSYDDLKTLYPNLKLDSLIKGLVIAPFENANVQSTKYFERLNDFLVALDTPSIVAYLQWSALNSIADFLVKEIRDEHFHFFGKVLRGQDSPGDRNDQCVASASDSIGWLIGQYFVKVAFSDDAKKLALSVIDDIIDATRGLLKTLDWMDDETRAAALKKLNLVSSRVGYPDAWPSYDDVDIQQDYFLNKMAFRWHESTKMLETFDKPLDRSQWEMTPQTVNAYYSPPDNSQNFPAGILDQPYFSLLFPDEMTFGGYGMIAGHELSHGFDNHGRLYTGEGKLENWWTDASGKKFAERAQCFVNQYNTFCPLPGHCVNGKLTLGENLADNAGLKNAFLGLQSRIGDEEGNKVSIVDILTRYQLFFTAFAQGWCSKARTEEIIRRLEQDVHSPPEARVMGSIQNHPYFGQVFQCATGTTMNPVDKCTLF